MVTHWESSSRPLYVRTIWKDGQHHVILDKTKEHHLDVSISRRSKQCSSSQSSHRSTIRSASSAGVSLKVSSVRVLLSGIKGFKNGLKDNRIREKSIERPKTWAQPPSRRVVTCKDLNKEVTFKAIQGYKAPKLSKSKTVDSDLRKEHAPEKYESNIVLDNALSEKVMIWLDLAAQTDKDLKGDCALRAQACNMTVKAEKQFEDTENASENIADSSILKNTSPRQDEKKNEIIVYSNEEIEMPQENFYHVITPTICDEDHIYREESRVEEENEPRVNSVKRQLHIFMPNLPKKSSDCDSSILSSKISVN